MFIIAICATSGITVIQQLVKDIGLKDIGRGDEMDWKPEHYRYVHAGKKLVTHIWRNIKKKRLIVVSNAWLGKPYYRMGYMVELKKTPGLKKIKTSYHFKKKNALAVARKWRN